MGERERERETEKRVAIGSRMRDDQPQLLMRRVTIEPRQQNNEQQR